MTSVSKNDAHLPLQLHQLTRLVSRAGGVEICWHIELHLVILKIVIMLTLFWRSFHSCPVKLLSGYLALRGTRPGATFTSADRLPVSKSTFSMQLFTRSFMQFGPHSLCVTAFESGRPPMQQTGGFLVLRSD